MIYGYVRVSTNKQVVDNQHFEISTFCKKKNIYIDKWIEESISGTKSYEERGLGKILRKCKKGDILICTEISRLGRSLFMIMDILNICMKKGTQVWTIKEGYRLGEDIQSKVLAFAFGLSAEIERSLISQRTKESLARLKAEGKKLGRPLGSKNKKNKLEGKEEEIVRLINLNTPVKKISKKMHVHPNTMTKYLKLLMPEKYAKLYK
ncbi:MAG TPA: invertase [Firmicutes bacterium]|nr:invertase [Bacillota bacterium]